MARAKRSFLRDNGLTLALLALFLFSLVGQAWSGFIAENLERAQHGEAPQTLAAFLGGGEFLSSLFENWESEFLQMWAFVMLTAYLFQRGSPESRDPDAAKEPQDRDPKLDVDDPKAPWPVRAGGLVRALYSHSLGLFLLVMFLISFVLHWLNSTRHAAEESMMHGQLPDGPFSRLVTAEFWFESFQNWQSEFAATAVLILSAIWLRERHSPESKPVSAPHGETGT